MGDGGSGEKTEEPTPERLRKLRKEGNVAKSQDVNSAVSFLATFVVLAGTIPFISDEMINIFKESMLAIQMMDEPDSVVPSRLLLSSLLAMVKSVAPACAAALVIGVAGNIAQVGFLFTTKPITPDLNKINPINGLKGMFKMKKLVELGKTIIKFTLIAYLSYAALKDAMRDVVMIIRSDVEIGMKVIGGIIWDFCIRIGGVFIVIAAFDAFYQRRRYTKDNMMSKYDVKQEYKQSEGDPQMKADRKAMHREIMNSAAPQNVKKADVVVRNPDHIAVAIKYDREKGNGAPVVGAKGTRLWADKVLEAAKHYGIPIVRNVPLAQALEKLDVGEEIPEELYEAVAEVLNFVYELAKQQDKRR
jgi:flagellar biosynthetic protein FlhB